MLLSLAMLHENSKYTFLCVYFGTQTLGEAVVALTADALMSLGTSFTDCMATLGQVQDWSDAQLASLRTLAIDVSTPCL